MSNKYKYFQPNKLDLKDEFGDCTMRALCKVFNKNWQDMFDYIIPVIKKYQVLPCYMFQAKMASQIAEGLGLVRYKISNAKGSKRPTVSEFAKTHPHGTYLLSLANHVVAVKDGYYYDTWDCGHKSLYGYYRRADLLNTWVIDGRLLPEFEIEAESFDEAIYEARKINKNYNGGHIKDDKCKNRHK